MPEPIQTKACSKCKKIKPFSEFYKDSRTKTGLMSGCKLCHCQATLPYAKTTKGKNTRKRYAKIYRQTSKGKSAAKKHHRRYYASVKGKIARSNSNRRYRKSHPVKKQARKAVFHAVRNGTLPQARSMICSCGKTALQYHHPSYEPEHWLDVIPVCRKCHINIHAIP